SGGCGGVRLDHSWHATVTVTLRCVTHTGGLRRLAGCVIAAAILDDPEKQSSVRRMYDSGRRNLPH
ncbi:hypothetical protein, partial [Streptomyces caniscabiei]